MAACHFLSEILFKIGKQPRSVGVVAEDALGVEDERVHRARLGRARGAALRVGEGLELEGHGDVAAAHAAAFHESPITPELSALEIVPLEGIRERKVKEIALEVAYAKMTDETVRKIREMRTKWDE